MNFIITLQIIWTLCIRHVTVAFVPPAKSSRRTSASFFPRRMSTITNPNDVEKTLDSPTLKVEVDQTTFTKTKTTTMIPLSEQPMLLVSSKPLLSRDECNIVIQYLELTKDGNRDPLNDVFFEKDGNYVFSTAHESKINNNNNNNSDDGNNTYKKAINDDGNETFYEQARNIIYRVRSEIDRLTNSKSHSGDFALPRFLSFKVEQIPDPSKDGVKQTLHSLLPDGLHSDNVNDMYTRHISALLYLSDEVDECDVEENGLVGGSTTFPLALPLGQNPNDKTAFDKRVEEASMKLIKSNILHTGKRDWENGELECTLLESAAYSVFHRDIVEKGKSNSSSSSDDNDNKLSKVDLPKTTLGIRVNPKPGQLCMFHNLLDDGSPDPLSFHAGEAILGRNNLASSSGKKVLLVFFKTIPLEDHSLVADSKNELAMKSKASRDWIKEQYY